MMNLSALSDLVLECEARVARARRNTGLQRRIVSHLQGDGRDITEALDLLASLEGIEAVLIEGRDRIARVAAQFVGRGA